MLQQLSMLSFRHNFRNTIGLAFAINSSKAYNCCYKGTVFLYMIFIGENRNCICPVTECAIMLLSLTVVLLKAKNRQIG